MGAESETVMPSVNEQCEQRKGDFYSLYGAAEYFRGGECAQEHIFPSYIEDFCSAYYFRLPGCLLSCIDILTL